MALAVGLLVVWPYRHAISVEDLKAAVESIAEMGPWAFFACMAVLPLFWVPVSPFLLLAPVFGTGVAITGSLLAVAINMSLAWLVSGKWFRPFFERLVARFGYSVPTFSDRGMTSVAVMLRITPGIPFPLQNYLLGLARMPYGKFMLVSVPISGAASIGIILFGDAVLRGNLGLAMFAVALLILIALIVRHVRGRYMAQRV